MSEPTMPGATPEPEPEEERLGLTLSELVGEVWSPVERRQRPDVDAPAVPLATDPNAGDLSSWNP